MQNPHHIWFEKEMEKEVISLLPDLRQYLRSKLEVIKVDGQHSYYSCGVDYHHRSNPKWKPFNHFRKYCDKKGLDWVIVKDILEDHLGRRLTCQCQLVNDEAAMRRDALRRSFGIDFSSCELVDDLKKTTE